MVGGGRMVLLLLGRTPHDPTDQGPLGLAFELLETSLNELVNQVTYSFYLHFEWEMGL